MIAKLTNTFSFSVSMKSLAIYMATGLTLLVGFVGTGIVGLVLYHWLTLAF